MRDIIIGDKVMAQTKRPLNYNNLNYNENRGLWLESTGALSNQTASYRIISALLKMDSYNIGSNSH